MPGGGLASVPGRDPKPAGGGLAPVPGGGLACTPGGGPPIPGGPGVGLPLASMAEAAVFIRASITLSANSPSQHPPLTSVWTTGPKYCCLNGSTFLSKACVN